MKNYLVVYYSKTGNSKFIAEKLAKDLDCDIKSITPSINGLILLFFLSIFRVRVDCGITKEDLASYDEVIVLGPIWGGLLIAPLRSVLRVCVRAKKAIHFAVSCETSETEKDGKYGYEGVLTKARKVGSTLIKTTCAFSTSLVRTEDEAPSLQMSEKTKFTRENFSGLIQTKFDDFLNKIKST